MKLLIAYDGSDCSDAALDDLVRAGLPETGEVLIISVGEVGLTPVIVRKGFSGDNFNVQAEQLVTQHINKGEKASIEAEIIVNHAKKRLQKILPGWHIGTEATYGSPARDRKSTR